MAKADKQPALSPLQLLLKHAPTFMIIKPYCPFCENAKGLLKQEDIKYNEYVYTEVPEVDKEISTVYGHKTYPKIFINDEFVGGYDNLQRKYNNRNL
ncbi:glutaredoxin 3 [Pancytospora epiphaga]|nr:glutaredoxin 3 [Pancytospora epiphaga]